MSEEGKGVGAGDTNRPDQPTDDEYSQPAGAIAAQPQSIWFKYVTVAEQLDRQMMKKWKTNMGNLLIFAALFTAIVTAFTIDAMSVLDENASTKLLRILVEQSTGGRIPQPDPPPSIMTVNILWLLSITSSLAATTWAILSLEWCVFLTEEDQAEDYKDMAEKKQRKFEAVRRWKLHIVVASIPFFLHISLFLFIAGLWLRVRDINKKLGFIVGIPGLVIASSYVIVTLLPIITEAPFHTSTLEVVRPLVNRIKYFIRLRHFVRPPLIFSWISRLLAWIARKSPSYLNSLYRELASKLRPPVTLYTTISTVIYYGIIPPRLIWTVVTTILPLIFPTFRPGGNPFEELNRLQNGSPSQDKGVHQRALFRLMNTPLTHSEVKEVLKELYTLGKVEESPDHSTVKLLVLSLSSVLAPGLQITVDDMPIFDHCTGVLTEEMDRAFRDAEYNPRNLVRNTTVSNGLKNYLNSVTPPPPSRTGSTTSEEYWNKAILLLWLSPSQDKIRAFVKQLTSRIRFMESPLLQRIIRGLHATMFTFLDTNQTILEFPLPDFSRWNFSHDGTIRDISAFLQSLLAEFHKAVQPPGQNYKSPTTIPSLIVDCLKLLDNPPRQDITISLDFHTALCFLTTLLWRSDPGVFEADPPVARVLVKSANRMGNTPGCLKELAVRLSAIANGPKHLILGGSSDLEIIANLYRDPLRGNSKCLSEFIHVIAAMLEAVLVKENPPLDLRVLYRKFMRNIVPTSFFTDDHASNLCRRRPDLRLPYLYSLAIALSYGIEGIGLQPLEIFNFLEAPREQSGNLAVERTLDTNALAVAVLRLALPRRHERVVRGEELQNYLDPITRALEPLKDIIENGKNWRMRWKSIYLLADIKHVLHPVSDGMGELQSLIDRTSSAVRAYLTTQRRPQGECVPRDWATKRDALRLCGLEEEIRRLAAQGEADEAVYRWWIPGKIPCLSLYPQRIRLYRSPRAPDGFSELLQRFVDGPTTVVNDMSDSPMVITDMSDSRTVVTDMSTSRRLQSGTNDVLTLV